MAGPKKDNLSTMQTEPWKGLEGKPFDEVYELVVRQMMDARHYSDILPEGTAHDPIPEGEHNTHFLMLRFYESFGETLAEGKTLEDMPKKLLKAQILARYCEEEIKKRNEPELVTRLNEVEQKHPANKTLASLLKMLILLPYHISHHSMGITGCINMLDGYHDPQMTISIDHETQKLYEITYPGDIVRMDEAMACADRYARGLGQMIASDKDKRYAWMLTMHRSISYRLSSNHELWARGLEDGSTEHQEINMNREKISACNSAIIGYLSSKYNAMTIDKMPPDIRYLWTETIRSLENDPYLKKELARVRKATHCVPSDVDIYLQSIGVERGKHY